MKIGIKGIEREVSRALGGFPGLKAFLRYGYFMFYGLLGKLFVRNVVPLGLEEIGEDECETFKGYYDVCPENDIGLVFAYSTMDATFNKPGSFKYLSIKIFDSSNLKEPIASTDTRAFNWQQGSRAHWFDSQRLIYNDFCDDRQSYVSKIWNVSTDKIEKLLSHPIESLLNKDEFLSLNFVRIASLRPDYGYFAHKNGNGSETCDLDEDEDGIWRVNIHSGEATLIYSIAEILETSRAQYIKGTDHKLNHLMANPSGDLCLAVHRYFNGAVRQGRMLLLSMNLKKIVVLPTGKVVSHYCWLNDKEVVAYVDNELGELGYYLINVEDESIEWIENVNELRFGDGHPSPLTKNDYVTDTYPNRWGYQKLLMISDDKKAVEVGSFEHQPIYRGESRCDLHPVFCSHSGFVYFDSLLSKKRRLYRIKMVT